MTHGPPPAPLRPSAKHPGGTENHNRKDPPPNSGPTPAKQPQATRRRKGPVHPSRPLLGRSVPRATGLPPTSVLHDGIDPHSPQEASQTNHPRSAHDEFPLPDRATQRALHRIPKSASGRSDKERRTRPRTNAATNNARPSTGERAASSPKGTTTEPANLHTHPPARTPTRQDKSARADRTADRPHTTDLSSNPTDTHPPTAEASPCPLEHRVRSAVGAHGTTRTPTGE